MQPLSRGKTLSYTFLLPLLYGQNKQELSKHLKNIDNVYIDKDEQIIHCVDKANKAIYSPKIARSFQSQYKLYFTGRYSEFGAYFKLLILKFWNGDSLLQSVLFKTNYSIDWWKQNHRCHFISNDKEYWIKPNIKLETWKETKN